MIESGLTEDGTAGIAGTQKQDVHKSPKIENRNKVKSRNCLHCYRLFSGTLLHLYRRAWIAATAVFSQKAQHLVHRRDIRRVNDKAPRLA